MNFITVLKTTIVGIMATVTTTVVPVMPTYSHQTALPKPILASPIASPVVSQPAQTQTPVTTKVINATESTSSPLPLDGRHYYYIQGTHSYLGQSINYLMLVPKTGGSFSGAISGACEAQLGANYAGGEGGRISGYASGKCNILFVKYQGTIPFKGNLYPAEKKLVLELEGAHLPPITLNYN